jgi:hypothetical protein
MKNITIASQIEHYSRLNKRHLDVSSSTFLNSDVRSTYKLSFLSDVREY